MVTATLPSLTDESEDSSRDPRSSQRKRTRNARTSIAFSVESELTITPERYRTVSQDGSFRGDQNNQQAKSKAPALAGYVGLATGCGALVALSLFLPLPTRFGAIDRVTPGQAVSYSFYVVGTVAFFVAVFVFVGLRNLRGEEGKGWAVLFGSQRGYDSDSAVGSPIEGSIASVDGSKVGGFFQRN
jgi:hypothetical protein